EARLAVTDLANKGLTSSGVPNAAQVTAAQADSAAALRTAAKSTNRLKHPVLKMQLNAAARNLTVAEPLTRKELTRYGLGMTFQDSVGTAAQRAAMPLEGGKFMRYSGPVMLAGMAALGIKDTISKYKKE